MPAQLLVTGCPILDVIDVGLLLNEHPQVLLGIQRFSGLRELVDRSLLSPDRLVAPLAVETRIRGELLYARLRRRVDDGELELAGDVDPDYVWQLPRLDAIMGDVKVVVAVGTPQAGQLEHWRRTMTLARATERREFASRVFLLDADALVSADDMWLGSLLAFLRLPRTDRLDAERERLYEAGRARPPRPVVTSDPELRAWLEQRFAAELRRHRAAAAPRRADPSLNAEQRSARARERAELLEQARAGSQWPDQSALVESVYVSQARETFFRGSAIRRLRLTAEPSLPIASLCVNLIAPDPQARQVGRMDSIVQLARELAQLCTVRLICATPPPTWIGGAELRTVGSAAVHDDCDVVIYPAGATDLEILPDAPRKIAWLDGFEPPNASGVSAGIACADLVLAASGFLCELARQRGVSALHFPPGLDRQLLPAGSGGPSRGLLVTGLAEAAEHMQCARLSETMVRVRERRPEVDVTLFGGVPADGATGFLLHPDLGSAAEVLRHSAVHVTCAREGFGFLGATALACGAALVTTDLTGCRDYVVAGRTAVVAPWTDPEALAERVLALLEDERRRERLATAGTRLVRGLMRPWPEVARRLALLLSDPD